MDSSPTVFPHARYSIFLYKIVVCPISYFRPIFYDKCVNTVVERDYI
jgi:hypothetical protein